MGTQNNLACQLQLDKYACMNAVLGVIARLNEKQ